MKNGNGHKQSGSLNASAKMENGSQKQSGSLTLNARSAKRKTSDNDNVKDRQEKRASTK